jgi:YHS domain-containing protein
MKKLVIIVVAFSLLIGCKKQEVVQSKNKVATTFVKPKNPLNGLKYADTLDPYCKMSILKYGVSDTAKVKGSLYGFCSSMCKQEFLKKPETYLVKK